jgi:hypothetical protein
VQVLSQAGILALHSAGKAAALILRADLAQRLRQPLRLMDVAADRVAMRPQLLRHPAYISMLLLERLGQHSASHLGRAFLERQAGQQHLLRGQGE